MQILTKVLFILTEKSCSSLQKQRQEKITERDGKFSVKNNDKNRR